MNMLFLLMILLVAIVYLFRKRFGILMLLLFFCPTILVRDQSRGERYSSGIQEMGLAMPLFTGFDLVIEFSGHTHGMITNGGKPYYDMLLVVEVYSLFLLLFLYAGLSRYNRKGFFGNFIFYVEKFYTTPFFWGPMLACGIAICLLTDYNAGYMSSHYFSNQYLVYEMVYLTVYFTVLMVVMRHYFYFTAEEKFIALFLVLLFPVTGFSGEYMAITNMGSEEFYLENHVAVYPLVYALPKTVMSLFTHFFNEKYFINKTALAYGIMQSAAVLYLFPTLLNVNNEDKRL